MAMPLFNAELAPCCLLGNADDLDGSQALDVPHGAL